ncbi:F-box protein containing lrr, partial [Globisporangium splendens]
MTFFGFETSAGLKSLENLNLCGLSIDETAISWIVKGCHALESLNLSRCKTLTGFALLLVAPAVASGFLQYLNLKECPLLTDVGVKNLFTAQEEKSARHRVNNGTEDDAESEGTALTVLNLENCTQLGDDAMQIVGWHCPRQNANWHGIPLLGKIFRKLDALDISERKDMETPLCVIHLTMPRATMQQSIKQINLSATNVCDVGVSIIAANCKQLEWINLSKNVNKIAFVQAHVRGNFARREVRLAKFIINRNAWLIQRQYRPRYAIRMRIRRANALEIQQEARTIWIWYRKCKNRSDFPMRSLWFMQKVRATQGQWRKYKRRSNFPRYLGYYRRNATVIQSIWWRALAREFVKKKRIEMNQASLTIQRVFRGFATRKGVVIYLIGGDSDPHEFTSITENALSKHRRWLDTRRRCDGFVELQGRHYTSIAWRLLYVFNVTSEGGEVESVRYCIEKSEMRSLRARGQNARQAMIRHALVRRGTAVVIQKWIRSVQARRKMLKIRKWRRFVAAKCTHRYMKEWIRLLRLRLKREAKIHASVNIQRVFRGYRERVHFKAEKYRQECLKAGKLIQRMYRGFRGRCTYKQVRKEEMGAALLLQRAFRSRHARKIYEINQAVTALKAKEKYDRSIMGWLDAKRNPMDELYRRAKLLREKAVLVALKEKWEANKVAEERAARKFKREYKSIRDTTNETIGNFYGVRRKLYGVTENVYASHREFVERKERHVKLKHELVDLHQRVQQFKAAIQEASASRRMLDGSEVFELLKAHGLFLENVPASNQDDHE